MQGRLRPGWRKQVGTSHAPQRLAPGSDGNARTEQGRSCPSTVMAAASGHLMQGPEANCRLAGVRRSAKRRTEARTAYAPRHPQAVRSVLDVRQAQPRIQGSPRQIGCFAKRAFHPGFKLLRSFFVPIGSMHQSALPCLPPAWSHSCEPPTGNIKGMAARHRTGNFS